MAKWFVLIKERFHPINYIPMIIIFSWVNSQYSLIINHKTFSIDSYILITSIMLSFFFRMRLFDEIKDYEVDLKVNPTRPLARGIIKIPEVKKMLLTLICLELLLASQLGIYPLIVHFCVIAYSLLMYEEFFIGDFLRPLLTTYAVTHTFVSSLLALSIMILSSGLKIEDLNISDWFFILMNWAAFNLFEFARKTFAPTEERINVPSYSNIFGTTGAYFLSISQVFLIILLAYLNKIIDPKWLIVSIVCYILISSCYLFKPTEKTAKIFRNVSSLYLLIHYIVLAISIGAIK